MNPNFFDKPKFLPIDLRRVADFKDITDDIFNTVCDYFHDGTLPNPDSLASMDNKKRSQLIAIANRLNKFFAEHCKTVVFHKNDAQTEEERKQTEVDQHLQENVAKICKTVFETKEVVFPEEPKQQEIDQHKSNDVSKSFKTIFETTEVVIPHESI